MSAAYVIRVHGHLDPHWATWLACTDLVHAGDGTTRLVTGPIDQAQLHGILARLRDTGVALVLVEVCGETLPNDYFVE